MDSIRKCSNWAGVTLHLAKFRKKKHVPFPLRFMSPAQQRNGQETEPQCCNSIKRKYGGINFAA